MNDFRFPRHAHVRASADFKHSFDSGQRASGLYFRCQFLAGGSGDATAPAAGARLGMAISRKVDKRAVERNRLRRLIREWFRHRHHRFLPGDFIVSGKREAQGISAVQVFSDLDAIANRIGLKRRQPPGTMPGSSRPSPPGDGS
ncbi:ribonuclease P protein component [Xanthomonadaceae bacterium XH05]|nr:ribonuclease P protein component [Xanthomonadaceae bacterium XH05]